MNSTPKTVLIGVMAAGLVAATGYAWGGSRHVGGDSPAATPESTVHHAENLPGTPAGFVTCHHTRNQDCGGCAAALQSVQGTAGMHGNQHVHRRGACPWNPTATNGSGNPQNTAGRSHGMQTATSCGHWWRWLPGHSRRCRRGWGTRGWRGNGWGC